MASHNKLHAGNEGQSRSDAGESPAGTVPRHYGMLKA